MKDKSGPAFPIKGKAFHKNEAEYCNNVYTVEIGGGVSRRDWFIGMALSGWIQALASRHKEHGYSDENAAIEAVRLSAISASAALVKKVIVK